MGVMRGLGGALLLIGSVGLATIGDDAQPAAAVKEDEQPPNVVVVMSDDQTQDSMRYMTHVPALLGEKGATFPVSITNWPVCCPSRATFLTGQYVHNHQVFGNAAPLGGFERLKSAETLAVWLQRAGYYTAHIGKFLNGYEQSAVGAPPGWSEWLGTKRTYTFYGATLLESGQPVTYGSTSENPDDPAQPETYSTDVFTDKAVELINRRGPAREPFFLSVAYLAPHSGGPDPDPPSRCQDSAKPAARHLRSFASEPLPAPPNFNEADVSDKPAGISDREPLTSAQIATARRFYRCRGESLPAVDEGVNRIVDALRASGELSNTVIVYTSDNGFFHGEHRIMTGKNRVYEEAIRVPLLIRGPDVPKGVTVDDIAINADLAPTILDAAGADAGLAQDGRSLLPFARHPERTRGRDLLIQQTSGTGDDAGVNGVFYSAVRTHRYKYVENANGDIELYDLSVDPFELSNQHANPAYAAAEAALAARLAALRACAGKTCRTKPALELKLPRSVLEHGRSCRPPGDFIARVRGADGDAVEQLAFRVGSKLAGRDRAKPLKERIKARLLRDKQRPEIRAIAQLVDGRKLSLQKEVRVCD
jgi:N-acetylglucosamine-6-sulfatase